MLSNNLFFSLFEFLRELFFGKNEEKRKQSFLKKITLYFIFIVLCSSLWLNNHLINRTVELNNLLKTYKEKIDENKELKQKALNCEVEIKVLKEYTSQCFSKEK